MIRAVILALLIASQTYPTPGPGRNSYNPTPPPTPLYQWKLCGDITSISGCVPTSSTAAYESEGTGANGTWAGTPSGGVATTWYSASSNSLPYAGNFNGSDDAVSATISHSPTFLVTFWVVPNSPGSYATWVGTSHSVDFAIGSIETSYVGWINGTQCIFGTFTNTLQFVAFYYDGTNEYLYVNGSSSGSPCAASAPSAYSGTISFGNGAGLYPYTGTINYVQLYSPLPSSPTTVIANLYSTQALLMNPILSNLPDRVLAKIEKELQ